MDLLFAVLVYLGVIPYPPAADDPTVPALIQASSSSDESAEADGSRDDATRPRTCGRNCTF